MNVTVLDKKTGTGNGNIGEYAYLSSNISSFTDYYPFGMPMPGRNGSYKHYRMGFNGMENDDEIKGKGNSLNFGARMYDSRLGRWMSLDPLAAKYPALNPYNFVANSPLIFIDPDGKEIMLFKSVSGMNTVRKTLDTYFKGAIVFVVVDNKLDYVIKDLSILSAKDRIYADNLIKAIDSKDILVKVNVYKVGDVNINHSVVAPSGRLRSPGSYVEAIYDENKNSVTTLQEIVPESLNLADGFHGKKVGNNILHELLESYEAGKTTLKQQKSDFNTSTGTEIWKMSHDNDAVPNQSGDIRLIMYFTNKKGKLVPTDNQNKAEIQVYEAFKKNGDYETLHGGATK